MGLGELEVLNHVTLTGAVEEYKYGTEQVLENLIVPGPAKRTDGGEGFAYDVYKNDLKVGAPRASGAPSKRVPLKAYGRVDGRCISFGEHKMLGGQMIVNLREPGTRQVNAKGTIARELRSLNLRGTRLRNWAIAQMLTGTLAISEDDVKASVNYQIPTDNKPTAAASWATDTTDIPTALDAWVEVAENASGHTPLHALCNRTVMRYLMANTKVKDHMGQAAMREEIGRNGYIRQYHGLTFHVITGGYKSANGTFTKWIADDKLILVPEPSPDWCEMIEGSTMIAPLGESDLVEAFGKHAYTVLEKDPAGYKLIVGDMFIPALYVPGAVIYADVTP